MEPKSQKDLLTGLLSCSGACTHATSAKNLAIEVMGENPNCFSDV